MARYFLHLRDHVDEVLDGEGLELLDLEAVKRAVLEGARDVIAHEIKTDGAMNLRYRIDAEDETKNVVHSLPFKDAVIIVPEDA